MPGHEVIGVVEDVRENGLDQPAPATVYWPTMSGYLNRTVAGPTTIRQVTFVVRSTRAGTEGFLNQLRQAVWSVNPSLSVTPRTMREVYDRSLARTSFTLVMLAIAASMALLLGVVGIYGVIAYAVSQRRRELGIRAALGAQRRELTGMFVRHSLRALRHRGRDWRRRRRGVDTIDVNAVVRDHAARSRDLCQRCRWC